MYDNPLFACRINVVCAFASDFNDIFSFVVDFDAEKLNFVRAREL